MLYHSINYCDKNNDRQETTYVRPFTMLSVYAYLSTGNFKYKFRRISDPNGSPQFLEIFDVGQENCDY